MVKMMARCLIGAKPLPKPMLTYHRQNPQENIQFIFIFLNILDFSQDINYLFEIENIHSGLSELNFLFPILGF